MPKTRTEKEATVKELTDWLRKARSVVFARYEKLPVRDVSAFRRQAKEQGMVVTVAKKTLLQRAFKEAGIDADPREIEGNFATVLGIEDEVAPAKLVAEFAKEHEAMSFAAGVIEKRLVDAAALASLAKLPGKQELRSRLVGLLNSPISGLVQVLAGNLRALVTALKAIQEKQPT